MSNYKIEFPLWIVIDPTSASQAGDMLAGNPMLYTDGIAAHADAADRLRKRDGKPKWVPLSSLRPGAVFEAQSGWRGVKTADEAPALDIVWCADLGDGNRVQANGAGLVKEIM